MSTIIDSLNAILANLQTNKAALLQQQTNLQNQLAETTTNLTQVDDLQATLQHALTVEGVIEGIIAQKGIAVDPLPPAVAPGAAPAEVPAAPQAPAA